MAYLIPKPTETEKLIAKLRAELSDALAANALLIAENRKLLGAVRRFSISMQSVLNACKNGDDWTGSMRCPNPATDGSAFALAEKVLEKDGK